MFDNPTSATVRLSPTQSIILSGKLRNVSKNNNSVQFYQLTNPYALTIMFCDNDIEEVIPDANLLILKVNNNVDTKFDFSKILN